MNRRFAYVAFSTPREKTFFVSSSLSEVLKITCHAEEPLGDVSISAQSAVNVLIIGLASEDCHVVLRTPHNDKEYVMQRSLEKGDEGIPAL